MYDTFDIVLARKRGAPDPEGNAARARQVLEAVKHQDFTAARALLNQITDPAMQKDLATLLEFKEFWSCIIA